MSGSWLLHECLRVLRFAVVGSLATLIHILVAWGLITQTAQPAILANLVAFLSAFGLSFAGNYYWTFRRPGRRRRAMLRFFLIAFSAFLVNNLVLAYFLRSQRLPVASSVILAALVIPLITYTLSRLWGFRLSHSQSKDRQDDP
ncbi:GtrA family protein [Pseudomonas citronellolis]